MRRPLAETLAEIVGALAPEGSRGSGVSVRGLRLDLPVEVALGKVPGAERAEELLADLPSWRWRTLFDHPLSRLVLECRVGPLDEAGLPPEGGRDV
jgi:hypothetical protein